MKVSMRLLTLVFLSLFLSAQAFAAAPYPLTETSLPGGAYLADADRLTVYTFDVDAPSESKCYDGCEAVWPPVLAPVDAVHAPLSVIARRDGARQLALSGRPLYTFARDAKPGDALGDGLGGVWHIVPVPAQA